MHTVIFCDFDGTIASRDVGYNLFKHFSNGANARLVPEWKAGILSTRDCLTQEAAMVQASAADIYRYLDQFEIDRGFKAFETSCRRQGMNLIVLSDGLDFYIRYILEKNSLGHLPVVTNIGRLERDRIIVEFPASDQLCLRCGTCKGEQIEKYRARNGNHVRVAFIGDGYSDACATRAVDLLLAKKDLERYCQENNIVYNRYDDFFDVARLLREYDYLPKTE